ncbi:hypothetical protein QQ008_13475 [Fulvivirgaceae bacterium BMA10]|uniref:DUF4890 domain-containing protein n=1 Tax=Splendidivirga corallicola TaxID=3051826 RepID=A0ABT8KNV4_9BACT|nr:hypothetical protein [Fulvivirgaceae bacterium BMA10]
MKNIKITALTLFVFGLMIQTSYAQNRQRLTPEERSERETSQIFASITTLSEEQKDQVKEISLKYSKSMSETMQNNRGDREAMRSAMQSLRSEKDKELKEVFTEEQFAQYEKLRKEAGDRRRGRRNG